MYCQMCNETDDGVKLRKRHRRVLCAKCAALTPTKVSKQEFLEVMWGEHLSEVPSHIKREFYQDYMLSQNTLVKYILYSCSDVHTEQQAYRRIVDRIEV
jgi:hypothetical protein